MLVLYQRPTFSHNPEGIMLRLHRKLGSAPPQPGGIVMTAAVKMVWMVSYSLAATAFMVLVGSIGADCFADLQWAWVALPNAALGVSAIVADMILLWVGAACLLQAARPNTISRFVPPRELLRYFVAAVFVQLAIFYVALAIATAVPFEVVYVFCLLALALIFTVRNHHPADRMAGTPS